MRLNRIICILEASVSASQLSKTELDLIEMGLPLSPSDVLPLSADAGVTGAEADLIAMGFPSSPSEVRAWTPNAEFAQVASYPATRTSSEEPCISEPESSAILVQRLCDIDLSGKEPSLQPGAEKPFDRSFEDAMRETSNSLNLASKAEDEFLIPNAELDAAQECPDSGCHVSAPETDEVSGTENKSFEEQLRTIQQRTDLIIPSAGRLTEQVPAFISPDGSVGLLALLVRTLTSAVYSIDGIPELVIKYQINFEFRRFHPLVKDFWFLRRLEHLGIAPAAYYLSGEKVVREFSAKTDVSMSRGDKLLCLNRANFRYIIMQRLGRSVHNVVALDGARTIHWAAQLGLEMLKVLEKLHKIGFIHGDVHQGNILLRGDEIIDGVALIDFEKATLNNESEPLKESPHAMHSPWNLLGHAPSFRDDIYRALQVVAIAMSGSCMYDDLQELVKGTDRSSLAMWRMHVPILEISRNRPSIFMGKFGAQIETAFHATFAEVLRLEPSEIPDYKSLASYFQTMQYHADQLDV